MWYYVLMTQNQIRHGPNAQEFYHWVEDVEKQMNNSGVTRVVNTGMAQIPVQWRTCCSSHKEPPHPTPCPQGPMSSDCSAWENKDPTISAQLWLLRRAILAPEMPVGVTNTSYATSKFSSSLYPHASQLRAILPHHPHSWQCGNIFSHHNCGVEVYVCVCVRALCHLESRGQGCC